jgi:hypothetical protein
MTYKFYSELDPAAFEAHDNASSVVSTERLAASCGHPVDCDPFTQELIFQEYRRIPDSELVAARNNIISVIRERSEPSRECGTCSFECEMNCLTTPGPGPRPFRKAVKPLAWLLLLLVVGAVAVVAAVV